MAEDGIGAAVDSIDVMKDNVADPGKVLEQLKVGESDETAAARENAEMEVKSSDSVDVSEQVRESVDASDLAAFQMEATLRTKKLGIYEPPSTLTGDLVGKSSDISSMLDGNRFSPIVRFTTGPGAEPVGYPVNSARYGRLTNVESNKYLAPAFV